MTGHTKTPNWLFELMPEMSERELRITLATCRETIGWKRQSVGISHTEYMEMTGLSRSGVYYGLRKAIERGTIIEVGRGKRGKRFYDFNFDYASITTSSPETIVPETSVQGTIVHRDIDDTENDFVEIQSADKSISLGNTPNTKKEVLKESKNLKKNALSRSPQEHPKTRTPHDDWYDAVKDVWGFTSGRNSNMVKMLHGAATDPQHKKGNLETPLTSPDELRAWARWYLNVKRRGFGDTILLSSPEKVQSSIGEWQSLGMQAKPTVRASLLNPMPNIQPRLGMPRDTKDEVLT